MMNGKKIMKTIVHYNMYIHFFQIICYDKLLNIKKRIVYYNMPFH